MEVNTTTKNNKKYCIVNVNPTEAALIIKSLSSQLIKRNSNYGKIEQKIKNNEYFSVSIDFTADEDIQALKNRIALLEKDNDTMNKYWGKSFKQRSKSIKESKNDSSSSGVINVNKSGTLQEK